MGFGTLFIGYFFLINISYFAYTDIVAGMIMLLGLYSLSFVNKSFKNAAIASSVFSAFALGEIILYIIDTFGGRVKLADLTVYLSFVRYSLIFVLTLFILRGISEIAKEVEADALLANAKASVPLSVVFLIAGLFELPLISNLFGSAVPFIYFAILLSVVIFIISNLLTIYKAYMQICMPSELNKKPKKSKLEFINKFYDSIEEKSKKYAEYKLRSTINKKNKSKRKK